MPASPQQFAWLGGTVHSLVVDGAQSDGRLTMLRSAMKGGAASPVHVHSRDDEAVMLLSGAAVVWCGAERHELGPGDTVFLPRGVPHGYRIVDDADVVTALTPAGFEAFLRHAGWDLADGPPPADWSIDVATLQAAAALTGERVLGPPLGVGDAMPPELQSWDR